MILKFLDLARLICHLTEVKKSAKNISKNESFIPLSKWRMKIATVEKDSSMLCLIKSS